MSEAMRGMRQGDPILSLFFILVLEFFSAKVDEAVNQGELDLYTIGECIVELHFAFVDDVIFFCSDNMKSMWRLKQLLDEFSSFFDL